MTLEVPLTLPPMEALPVADLPSGAGWLFEPKYDGFRCLLFRDGDIAPSAIPSPTSSGPLFPRSDRGCTWSASRAVRVRRRVDHPRSAIRYTTTEAASSNLARAKALPGTSCTSGGVRSSRQWARTAPAGQTIQRATYRSGSRLQADRQAIQFCAVQGDDISRHCQEMAEACWPRSRWYRGEAFRIAVPTRRTHDAEVQTLANGRLRSGRHLLQSPIRTSVEYLLMGLYDGAGRLNYVGRCGVGDNGHEIGKLLKPLVGGSGFTGNAPGGKSRWASGRERKPVPLEPRLVAEVSADHVENGRFRHGSRLIRWRDDKEPTACTMDQISR